MSEPIGIQLRDAIREVLDSFYSKEHIAKSRASARKNGVTLEEAAAEALARRVLERFEVTPKAKKKERRPRPKPMPPTKSKVMKVTLWLQVENNSKFVRGKKRVREEIEQCVLNRFGMEKERADDWEYTLSIPYETEEELDSIINDEILNEANRLADDRHCFVEADVTSVDDPERSW